MPSGSGGVAFPAPSFSGAGFVGVIGSGGVAFGAPSFDGAGVVLEPSGVTFPAPSFAGTGISGNSGSGGVTFGAPSLDGSGVVPITGTGGVTFGAPTLDGDGFTISGSTLPRPHGGTFQVAGCCCHCAAILCFGLPPRLHLPARAFIIRTAGGWLPGTGTCFLQCSLIDGDYVVQDTAGPCIWGYNVLFEPAGNCVDEFGFPANGYYLRVCFDLALRSNGGIPLLPKWRLQIDLQATASVSTSCTGHQTLIYESDYMADGNCQAEVELNFVSNTNQGANICSNWPASMTLIPILIP